MVNTEHLIGGGALLYERNKSFCVTLHLVYVTSTSHQLSLTLSSLFRFYFRPMPPKTPTPPTQDHKPVIFHKPHAPINNATGHLRTVVHKKQPGKSHGGQFAKLDNQTTSAKSKSVSKAFQQALVKARVAKKMNQKALAQAANVKLQEISDLEKGKMVGGAEGVRRRCSPSWR